jgi:hypothetical protein
VECLGNLLGTSTDEIGLVPSDGSDLVICSTDGFCTNFPPPDCSGAPARYLDIAPKPPDLDVTQILAATQSTNGTCVVWIDGGGVFTVAREQSFATQNDVRVQWVTRGGAPSAMVIGTLDDAQPGNVALELPPAAPSQVFEIIAPTVQCLPYPYAAADGLGSSVLTEMILDCANDGSGCTPYSFRALGFPAFEYYTDEDLDGVYESVPDEGALAYWSGGCADPADAYYFETLPFLGDIRPTSIGASMTAALDTHRSRAASDDTCEVPSTVLIGAPADGPLGGTGRMIVVYNSGDVERTQPFCTPVIP